MDDSLGDQALGPHVSGRRDEHPQRRSLGFTHRLAPFGAVPLSRNNSMVLQEIYGVQDLQIPAARPRNQ